VNVRDWATRVVKGGLFIAIASVFVSGVHMSRVRCPACLPEFASNGVKLDSLALELPANGDELRWTLYLRKPYSQAVRDVYGRQTNVDDVFLWLYPTQFVLACLYFSLIGGAKVSRLLFIAAGLIMVLAGWLDHRENSFIHAILMDQGSHFNQLAAAVRPVSMQKWLCFGIAALLGATGLAFRLRSDRKHPVDPSQSLTTNALRLLSGSLMLTSFLTIAGWAQNDRTSIRSGALTYSLFLGALLWLLYLEPIAEKLDGLLRARLNLR
jgi:hypothetical protein